MAREYTVRRRITSNNQFQVIYFTTSLFIEQNLSLKISGGKKAAGDCRMLSAYGYINQGASTMVLESQLLSTVKPVKLEQSLCSEKCYTQAEIYKSVTYMNRKFISGFQRAQNVCVLCFVVR